EATLGRESLPDETLLELRDRVNSARDDLRSRIDTLEPQFADVETRLKQLGPAPPTTEPREDAGLAAERDRLTKSHAELDTSLRQARLLSLRADQLADRITERRRTLFTQRLFRRTPSALQLTFWRGVAEQASDEVRSVGTLIKAWWGYAHEHGGVSGIVLAGATLLALAIAAQAFVRWWRRRDFVPHTETRFG